ncbi:MAG: hypothetical protein RJA70_376 [Pseudomonadota bacterium]|jgi:hypothetical protein
MPIAALSSANGASLPSLYLANDEIAALWSEGGSNLHRTLDKAGATMTAPVVLKRTTSNDPRRTGASLTGGRLATAWMEQPMIGAYIVDGGVAVEAAQIDGWFPALATFAGQVGVAWSDAKLRRCAF